MTCKIILHIGAPKCGSTFLQRVLLKNKTALKNHGVAYPHRGAGHPGNAQNLSQITKGWLDHHTDGADTLILSHEDLFALPLDGRRLRNLADSVQVVAFVRPFDGWLAADYSQTLKQCCTSMQKPVINTFEEFVLQREQAIVPTQFLSDWQDLFPENDIVVADHLCIRPTMERLIPALQDLDWSLPRWKSNPSMNLDHARTVHRHLKNDDFRTAKLFVEEIPQRPATTRALSNLHFQQEALILRDRYGVNV